MALAALKAASGERLPAVNVAHRRQVPTPVSPHPHELHRLCVEAVDRAIARTARRFRLTNDDAAELQSELWLKITAGQGRIIRRFRAQGTLETYLTRIAHHLLLDLRNRSWGRWRPCVAARQLGPSGVLFDRLVRRDGMTLDQAQCWFQTAHPASDWSGLAGLHEQLPKRPRRTFVPAELVDQHRCEPPVDLQAHAEAARDRRRTLILLKRALRSLPPTDQHLLIRRYVDDATVSALADDGLGEAKPLYRRCERLLRTVRHALERDGVTRESLDAWIGAARDHECAP
ncbi:MAG: sigma factor [Acidobacteriota bacterium]|nr:sigma factor [Acidobacteriota bacterium]